MLTLGGQSNDLDTIVLCLHPEVHYLSTKDAVDTSVLVPGASLLSHQVHLELIPQ
jgi:hypothetical protein